MLTDIELRERRDRAIGFVEGITQLDESEAFPVANIAIRALNKVGSFAIGKIADHYDSKIEDLMACELNIEK